MARKVLNRKELRRAEEAAESAGEGGESTTKKAAPKRKPRTKTPKEVRLKAYWGVFNQSMKRVAMYEYSERKQADKKKLELDASQKSPHFVMSVKEPVAE